MRAVTVPEPVDGAFSGVMEVGVAIIFERICFDFGLNFELAKSMAFRATFCPAVSPEDLTLFKAMSTICFLLTSSLNNFNRTSSMFENDPEPPF